jgi:hypothetical protein
MMKRTPGLLVMALGILALHGSAPVPAHPRCSASIQMDHSKLFGMPADESGDDGGDEGDDDGDSGDSK